ncbi:hypothetical protein SNE40_008259 [Patella caerulea]|uniref:Arrestin C-terminal-like domain-containing protein n=1 Tax=Patella caerulea TaxID=87958 RepID=A0AAN8JV95_PATCE
MKVKKLEIHYVNRDRVFYAGQNIEGYILLVLKKTTPINRICLNIGGRGNCLQFTKKINNRRQTYSAEVNYLSINLELIQSGQILNEGEVCLQFSALLPSSIPSSFEGSDGHIRYYCQVTVSTPEDSDATDRRNFTVIHNVDLNSIPNAKVPIVAKQTDIIPGMCCASPGLYKVNFQLEKTGFVPGEQIKFKLDIDNRTSLISEGITLTLRQIIKYKCFLNGRVTVAENTLIQTKTNNIELYNKQIVIPSRQKKHLETSARLPSLPPSKLPGCDIIDISYNIVLNISIHIEEMIIERQILVGTIPVRDDACSSTSQHTPRPDTAPPSYEECVTKAFTKGMKAWRPSYPYYGGESRVASLPGGNWV